MTQFLQPNPAQSTESTGPLLDERLDRYGFRRYRAAMHRSVGTPNKTIHDQGPAAARWYGFVFFGYVPPALLAGREAMSR
jgi:hypothetical protein